MWLIIYFKVKYIVSINIIAVIVIIIIIIIVIIIIIIIIAVKENITSVCVCQVKDVELSPVVNRDLSRRVRPVAGVTTAKQVIRDDIKLAAKLIRVLDKRAALYEKESKEETEAREKAEKEAAEVGGDVSRILLTWLMRC